MSTQPLEFAFIDPAVSDLEVLMAGFRPDVKPFLLDNETPALVQIAGQLRGQTQVAAIHVIAHGQPGAVNFSAGPVTHETIQHDATGLEQIGKVLGNTGEFLLWSCASGQGARGEALVSALRCATGAEVAAATGRVGSTARGGRWELDVRASRTLARAPLTQECAASYAGVMQITSAQITSITTDTGSSASDLITDDPTLVLNGTVSGKSGNVLKIWLSGGVFGSGMLVGRITLTGNANQIWSLDLTTSSVLSAANLTDGTYTITLNRSAANIGRGVLSTRTLIEDTTAPATPSSPDLAPLSDSGPLNTDNVTSVVTPTFTGTAEAGSTVTIFSDGVAVGSGVATGGSYSITTSTLAAGSHSITAKATDVAGNVSVASSGLAVTIDTTAPATPSVPDLVAASDSGTSNTDNNTGVVTPTFTGTAEAGSTVTIFSDGVAVGSGTATGGTYSITTSALAAGSHSITAKASDLAGNVSVASSGLAVTIDTTAPAVPSVPDLVAASDSGSSSTDNVTNIATPTFTGTAEAGSTVTIFSDGVAVGSGVAAGGSYSIASSALSSGLHLITATAADAAGNVSAASSALEVTIDSTAPSVPSAPDLAAASDSGPLNTDNITNLTALVFAGTAEAGSTVTIFSDGVAVGSGVATGGSYSVTTSVLTAGTHSITAKATDTAGNVSAASSALAVTIDTAAPAAPSAPDLTAASDTGISNTDNVTDVATPVFAGTAEAGSTVTIFSDGVAVGSGVATGGTYSITTSALSVTTHSITAKATDTAGNTSVASSGLSVTIIAPSVLVPSIPDLATSSDSGSSNTDNITRIVTPTFTGTAPAGSAVTLYSDGVAVGSGTATGGSYSITTSALSDGTHSIRASNSSGTSSSLSVTIDSTAPLAPAAPDLIAASDSGLSNSDNITNASTLTFIGSAEAGSTVTIYSDGVAVGSGVATGGSYSITASSLTAGSHSITAKATDAAGNVSAASSGLAVTIDTTAPAAPGTPDLTAASDSGSSSVDNVTNVTTPTFTGSAETGSTVTIFSDGVAVGSGVATGGNYSITTSALAAGTHSITATAADAAGNVSLASSGLAMTIDTTTPAAPSAPDLVAASDSGTSNTDNVTSVATPTFTGTAEAGSTVTIFSDGLAVGTATATGGSYAVTVSALSEGTHNITATATDAAGNASLVSSSLAVTIDTTAPLAPSAPDLTTSSDSGLLSNDDNTKVTTPTFVGTAESGGTVTIYSDGVAVGSGVATNGIYSITSSVLAAGTHSITAKTTDLAGNVSAVSSGPAVTIDTSAPSAPSVPDLAADSDLGSSSTDNITSLATPTFIGSAESGSTVTIYSDGVAVGSGTAINGSYAVDISALSEGTHSITATATDIAGNVGAASAGLSVTIDLTAPGTASTPDLIAASDTGVSSTDNITDVATPTFSGTADAGSTVTIYSDGVAVGSGVATSGSYSIATTPLADGSHSITAIATDVAGNDGLESSGLAVTIDATAPTLAVTGISPDTGTSNSDGITTAGTVTVSGTIDVADAARTVTVLRDGTRVGSATVNQSTGAWTLSNVTLAEGAHTLTAQATDVAGNVGTSDAFTATEDTTAPLAPAAPDLVAASDSGLSNTDNITNATTLAFTGSAESGSTVTIYSDGVAVGSGVATGGSYSITASSLTAGSHSITAKAADAAGNVSAASSGLTVTIDRTAPAAPGTPDLAAASDSGASSTDNVTNIATPTFTGSAETGSTVTIFSDGVAVGSGVATAGSYSIGTSTLTGGTHSITATAADVAGNVSVASSGLAVTIDTTAPTIAINTIAGDNKLDSSEAAAGFAISGTTSGAESGQTITVGIFNSVHALADTYVTTVGGGAWSVAVTQAQAQALARGSYTVTADVTDVAGNPATEATQGLAVVCYLEGTRILTPRGEVPIENLVAGDLVVTAFGETHSVQWIGHRRIDVAKHPRPELVAPVRIRRGAFANSVPQRDLLVSPDHALFVDGKLICARQLINGATIRSDIDAKAITYYHVELAIHAILLAEGLPAESYLDTGNRNLFSNAGAALVLHPDMLQEADRPTRNAGSCFPFAWDAETVQPIWQRLANRSAASGEPIVTHETTMEPQLRVLAGDLELKSICDQNQQFVVTLAAGVRSIRLRSRAARPTDTRPWLEDRRQLGIRVTRIQLWGAKESLEVPVDHPDLVEGWYAVEQDGGSLHRWTNGEAVLAIPPMDGPIILKLQLSGDMIYVVEAAPAVQTDPERCDLARLTA